MAEPTTPLMFRAVITAKSNSSGSWRYGWKEQTSSLSTGADLDPISYRQGTTTINPAIELNGAEVGTGTVVWLRERGYLGGQMWYEFAYEPSAGLSGTSNAYTGGTPVDITADNTWTQTNYQDSFPSAGKYLLNTTVTCSGSVSTLGSSGWGRVEARLWNLTQSAQIGHIVTVVFPQFTSRIAVGTAQIVFVYTATGADTYVLQARRVTGDGTVWSSARMEDPMSRCWNVYSRVKIA